MIPKKKTFETKIDNEFYQRLTNIYTKKNTSYLNIFNKFYSKCSCIRNKKGLNQWIKFE